MEPKMPQNDKFVFFCAEFLHEKQWQMINLSEFLLFLLSKILIKQLKTINLLSEMVDLPSEKINIETKW